MAVPRLAGALVGTPVFSVGLLGPLTVHSIAGVDADVMVYVELFRSSGKIFRDDNELFSEPSWVPRRLC